MKIKELSSKEKKEYNLLIKLYKRVLFCKKCNSIYGTDLDDKKENNLCIKCGGIYK